MLKKNVKVNDCTDGVWLLQSHGGDGAPVAKFNRSMGLLNATPLEWTQRSL